MQRSIASYTAYFRKLATEHYLIRHNPQQEDNNATIKGARKFVLFDTDEVITGLRSMIGAGPILFLEAYTFNGKENGAGDYRSAHQCRFIVAEKCGITDTQKLEAVYLECEGIIWDIANKILFDCNDSTMVCTAPFKEISLNDFAAEPVTNLWTGYSGWIMSFNFQFSRIDEMDPERATDAAIWQPFTPQPSPAPAPAPTDYNDLP